MLTGIVCRCCVPTLAQFFCWFIGLFALTNIAVRCYIDQHTTLLATKGSTLERALDEGLGTEAFAMAPFFWSDEAHGQQ